MSSRISLLELAVNGYAIVCVGKLPLLHPLAFARQRVGPAVMTKLFELVARPLATQKTQGAFLGGLRLMAVDGTVFDVPDTEANAKVFGYPGTRPGTKAAFPFITDGVFTRVNPRVVKKTGVKIPFS